MQEKTARLQRLLAEGYSIVDIESDERTVETTLRRGTAIVRLQFERDEAEDLLYLSAPAR